jgi:hypothetical protein
MAEFDREDFVSATIQEVLARVELEDRNTADAFELGSGVPGAGRRGRARTRSQGC